MSNVAITEWGEERSGLNEEQVILILMIIDIDTAILVVVAILVAHSRCRQAPNYTVLLTKKKDAWQNSTDLTTLSLLSPPLPLSKT